MTIKNTASILLCATVLFLLACPMYPSHAPEQMATLVFYEEIFGKITILDHGEDLVVELTKRVGRKLEISLDEGEYLVVNSPEDRIFKAWITLEEGTRFELRAEDLTPEGAKMRQVEKPDDASQLPAEELQPPKETLLSGQSSAYFFGEIGGKTTELDDEFAVLVGGQLGWTFNHSFSIGFAGYARAEHANDYDYWDGYRYCEYRGPAYGGITTAFIFPPKNLIHFKVGALFGAGYAWDRHFYIFEPEFDVVINISQIVRIQAGISYPLTDRDINGLDDVMFNVSFRFGK